MAVAEDDVAPILTRRLHWFRVEPTIQNVPAIPPLSSEICCDKSRLGGALEDGPSAVLVDALATNPG